MENRTEKNQKHLLKLLKGSFEHYGFSERTLQMQIQHLIENMLEAGQIEQTGTGGYAVVHHK